MDEEIEEVRVECIVWLKEEKKKEWKKKKKVEKLVVFEVFVKEVEMELIEEKKNDNFEEVSRVEEGDDNFEVFL